MGIYYYELCLVVSAAFSIITASAALATAFIILRQAGLLREQNQLNALISLQKDWESLRLRRERSMWARKSANSAATMMALEPILEFLEEFAGFWVRGVLDDGLVWDSTIGWHAARYYFYSRDDGSIDQLRAKWGGDQTLYQNLEKLWNSYVKVELRNRPGLDQAALDKEIRETKSAFLEAEKYDASDSSESSDRT